MYIVSHNLMMCCIIVGFDIGWEDESSAITCEHSLSQPDFLGKVR